ncbi:hypothetical protein V565_161870, partial [Rhizoctonia solani 123E]
FTRSEIDLLVIAMDVPPMVISENGVQEPARTALAMLLRRLAFPSRLSDIYQAFGWESSRVSRITRTLANYLYRRWRFLLHFDAHRLTPEKLEYFAQKCLAQFVTSAYSTMVGSETMGSNFRLLSVPTGSVFMSMDQSKVEDMMKPYTRTVDWQAYLTNTPILLIRVRGPPVAYGLSSHLISPYKGLNLSKSEKNFNQKMSKVRESVEWSFAELGKLFAFLEYRKGLRVLSQPVGVLYLAAVLLCNAHTILHGSQILSYFQCPPPSLGEYFHGTIEDALAFLAKIEEQDKDVEMGGLDNNNLTHDSGIQTASDLDSPVFQSEGAQGEVESYMDILL